MPMPWWSACSPSTPTIQVWIPLKNTVFSVRVEFEKNENKQKEARVGPLKKTMTNHLFPGKTTDFDTSGIWTRSWQTSRPLRPNWIFLCLLNNIMAHWFPEKTTFIVKIKSYLFVDNLNPDPRPRREIRIVINLVVFILDRFCASWNLHQQIYYWHSLKLKLLRSIDWPIDASHKVQTNFN